MDCNTATRLSRTCVFTAGVGILAHIWLLATHGHGIWMTVVSLIMMAMCLPCIPGLWTGSASTRAPAQKLMIMSMGMAVLHTSFLMTMSSAGPSEHHHAALSLPSSTGASSMSATMLIIIGIELITAFLAAAVMRSHLTIGFSHATVSDPKEAS